MTIHRVDTTFTGASGSPWFNSLYFLGPGDATEADASVVALWTALATSVDASVAWTVSGEVVDIDETTGTIQAFHQHDGGSGQFTGAGEQLAFATQGLVRLRTDGIVGGRRVLGRIFIPAPFDTQLDHGRPTSGYRTNLLNAVDGSILSSPQFGTNPLVVWSRPIPADDPDGRDPRAGSAHVVQTASVWTEFAVQRSRRD